MTLPLFASEHVAATEARESEYHPTPGEVVRALFLGMAEAGHEPLPTRGEMRESAAGEGALVRAFEACAPGRWEARRWHLHERRAGACAILRRDFHRRGSVIEGDFLARPDGHPFVALDITNPPWSRAIEWAAASLLTASHVALHVPLATVETPERAAFLRAHPCDVYPLEWRPNYDGRGTVSRAVCWLVWGPGRGGRWYPLRRPS